MKHCLYITFIFLAFYARAQNAPVKWATQETFFEELTGKFLPDFSGETLNAKFFSKKNLQNQIVVINFWFEECPPCVKEMPTLNRLVEEYKKDSVRFIAITYDERKKARKFQRKTGFKYEIICLTKDEIRKLNINHGYPSNILVGRNGKIIKAISAISFTDEVEKIKAQTVDFDSKLKNEIINSGK